MKRMRKLVASLMLLAAVMVMVTGCGSSRKEEKPKQAEEPKKEASTTPIVVVEEEENFKLKFVNPDQETSFDFWIEEVEEDEVFEEPEVEIQNEEGEPDVTKKPTKTIYYWSWYRWSKLGREMLLEEKIEQLSEDVKEVDIKNKTGVYLLRYEFENQKLDVTVFVHSKSDLSTSIVTTENTVKQSTEAAEVKKSQSVNNKAKAQTQEALKAKVTSKPEKPNLPEGSEDESDKWPNVPKPDYDMSNVKVTGLVHTYDGTAKYVTVEGVPITVTYTVIGDGKINPGTYKVTIKFKGLISYNPIPDKVVEMTILPKPEEPKPEEPKPEEPKPEEPKPEEPKPEEPKKDTLKDTDVTVTLPSNLEYDGKAKEVLVTLLNNVTANVTVTYEGGTTDGKVINEGSYTAVVTVTGVGNYEGVVVKRISFVITKKEEPPVPPATKNELKDTDVTVSIPTNLVENGRSKEVSVTLLNGVTANIAVTYSGNTTDGKPIKEGSYTAAITVTGTGNYTGTVEKKVSFTIVKETKPDDPDHGNPDDKDDAPEEGKPGNPDDSQNPGGDTNEPGENPDGDKNPGLPPETSNPGGDKNPGEKSTVEKAEEKKTDAEEAADEEKAAAEAAAKKAAEEKAAAEAAAKKAAEEKAAAEAAVKKAAEKKAAEAAAKKAAEKKAAEEKAAAAEEPDDDAE